MIAGARKHILLSIEHVDDGRIADARLKLPKPKRFSDFQIEEDKILVRIAREEQTSRRGQ